MVIYGYTLLERYWWTDREALLNRKWYFRCLAHGRRKTFIYIMVFCVCVFASGEHWAHARARVLEPAKWWALSMLTAFIWRVSQANIGWVSACLQQWATFMWKCARFYAVVRGISNGVYGNMEAHAEATQPNSDDTRTSQDKRSTGTLGDTVTHTHKHIHTHIQAHFKKTITHDECHNYLNLCYD